MHEVKLATSRQTDPLACEHVPQHRVIFYLEEKEFAQVYQPKLAAEDSFDQLSTKLDRLVEFGFATGGHIEAFVNEQIGWCQCAPKTGQGFAGENRPLKERSMLSFSSTIGAGGIQHVEPTFDGKDAFYRDFTRFGALEPADRPAAWNSPRNGEQVCPAAPRADGSKPAKRAKCP